MRRLCIRAEPFSTSIAAAVQHEWCLQLQQRKFLKYLLNWQSATHLVVVSAAVQQYEAEKPWMALEFTCTIGQLLHTRAWLC